MGFQNFQSIDIQSGLAERNWNKEQAIDYMISDDFKVWKKNPSSQKPKDMAYVTHKKNYQSKFVDIQLKEELEPEVTDSEPAPALISPFTKVEFVPLEPNKPKIKQAQAEKKAVQQNSQHVVSPPGLIEIEIVPSQVVNQQKNPEIQIELVSKNKKTKNVGKSNAVEKKPSLNVVEPSKEPLPPTITQAIPNIVIEQPQIKQQPLQVPDVAQIPANMQPNLINYTYPQQTQPQLLHPQMMQAPMLYPQMMPPQMMQPQMMSPQMIQQSMMQQQMMQQQMMQQMQPMQTMTQPQMVYLPGPNGQPVPCLVYPQAPLYQTQTKQK